MAAKQHGAMPVMPPSWGRDAPKTHNGPFVMLVQDVGLYPPERLNNEGFPDTEVIKIFGTTPDGVSACLFVRGFRFYCYVKMPSGYTPLNALNFVKEVNALLGAQSLSRRRMPDGKRAPNVGRPPMLAEFQVKSPISAKIQSKIANTGDLLPKVFHIEIVSKRTLEGYQREPSSLLKVTVCQSRDVYAVQELFQKGFYSQVLGKMVDGDVVYETNIPPVLRFLVDNGIMGASYITCSKFKPVSGRTNCQWEAATVPEFITPEKTKEDTHPLRELSFDIECLGRTEIFPEAEMDPVIQIACHVAITGAVKPFISVIFVLDTCAPIRDVSVFSFKEEKDLLIAWRNFVLLTDPDILTGYNIINFDLPYLIKRASVLKIDEFACFSRLKDVPVSVKNVMFSSKQRGTTEGKQVGVPGRLVIDMLLVIQNDHKLRSYTLNYVSEHFLNDKKNDICHTQITPLQNGTPEDRQILARYCLQDALLPHKLATHLGIVSSNIAMSRVTGVPLEYVLFRGQQIRTTSKMLRKTLLRGFVVQKSQLDGDEIDYQGATVIEPEKGFYDKPVATLDFSSLYPSIMMAHNLCYTTLVVNADCGDGEKTTTPIGARFVDRTVLEGILPEILKELTAERKRYKAKLAAEKDPMLREQFNAMQLAYKTCSNSVYGYTAAHFLPCLKISASVTAYGREMIQMTKNMVEEHYCRKNGYEHDAKVIYGDTDSVMVVFGNKTVAECIKLGREAADYVSKIFKKPVELLFEKVFYPYLLISKKRYAGLYWTSSEKPDKLAKTGIETERRDNCKLVAETMEKVLQALMDMDVERAKSIVRDVVDKLSRNEIDLFLLVITKKYSKKEYAGLQPHITVVEKMTRRDPGSAPALGTRVAYVITAGGTGSKSSENAEDPLYVQQNDLPIDMKYYLENQLEGPLKRILEPVLGKKSTDDLFKVTHRTKSTLSSNRQGGGLMMANYLTRVNKCLGCKAPTAVDSVICRDCEPKRIKLTLSALADADDKNRVNHAIWVNCQRCVGVTVGEVLCANNDCEQFYKRFQTKKRARDANDVLELLR